MLDRRLVPPICRVENVVVLRGDERHTAAPKRKRVGAVGMDNICPFRHSFEAKQIGGEFAPMRKPTYDRAVSAANQRRRKPLGKHVGATSSTDGGAPHEKFVAHVVLDTIDQDWNDPPGRCKQNSLASSDCGYSISEVECPASMRNLRAACGWRCNVCAFMQLHHAARESDRQGTTVRGFEYRTPATQIVARNRHSGRAMIRAQQARQAPHLRNQRNRPV